MHSLDFDVSLTQDNGAIAAADALARIRSKRNTDIVTESKLSNISRIKQQRDMVEEFTDPEMDRKLKTDQFFYETLFVKLPATPEAETAISEMVSAQIEFFKVLNIAPVTNHFTEFEFEQNSVEVNQEKASSIIESFFRDNLYALSSDEKAKRYKSAVVPLAESYVSDYEASPTGAIDLAYKTIVVEKLLKHIQSSVYVNLYYEDCLSSDYYSEFFDLKLLEESKVKYDSALRTAAQVIAISI